MQFGVWYLPNADVIQLHLLPLGQPSEVLMARFRWGGTFSDLKPCGYGLDVGNT